MLSKAFTRFPGGTQDRWEKIADMVGRPVNEASTQAYPVTTTTVNQC